MKELLKDSRVLRLLAANTLGSIGSGITIFAVPWLLVSRDDGAAAYRHITIVTTIVLFLIMPAYGLWVDRSSRKRMVLLSEVFGAVATAATALIGGLRGEFSTGLLMAIYFCGMLYYTLHYPAKWALVQQLFNRTQYQSLTGLMEVQGQTAMLAAGALGGLAVEHLPLWAILAIDCSTYVVSFALQASLPYEATHLKAQPAAAKRPGMIANLVEGWNWLAGRPRLAVFLTASIIPFIVVMAGNYLVPVYVQKTLAAGPKIFAAGEMTFAVGAIVAGLILPRLIARHSAPLTIPLTMSLFLVGLLLQAALPAVLAFLAAMTLLGFGNAGSRVARSALMLHVVPNEVMGRITVFFSVLDRLLRTLLVMSMAVVDTHGPRAGFAVLIACMSVAVVGAWLTRQAGRAEPATSASA